MSIEEENNKRARGVYSEDIILRMVANFPGFCFCEDHEDGEINGADLVDWLVNEVYYLWNEDVGGFRHLIEERAKDGSQVCECCQKPIEHCDCLGPPTIET